MQDPNSRAVEQDSCCHHHLELVTAKSLEVDLFAAGFLHARVAQLHGPFILMSKETRRHAAKSALVMTEPCQGAARAAQGHNRV